MKANEELLKMSMDELRMYCSSLKFYTIDKYDYRVLAVQDISLISIECFPINDNIRLKYRLQNDNSDNIYQSLMFDISKENHTNYAGIFENKEDAIYAVKRRIKRQKLNEIEEHKRVIKMIEEEINEIYNDIILI
jgi:hypothetical protein